MGPVRIKAPRAGAGKGRSAARPLNPNATRPLPPPGGGLVRGAVHPYATSLTRYFAPASQSGLISTPQPGASVTVALPSTMP